MTITIDATYENGVLKLSRPLPLREHEAVRVTVELHGNGAAEVETEGNGCSSAGLSLAEQIVAAAKALPLGTLDSLPDDLASQHDHYLYGTPKRPE